MGAVRQKAFVTDRFARADRNHNGGAKKAATLTRRGGL
jgi:hypothetical protein